MTQPPTHPDVPPMPQFDGPVDDYADGPSNPALHDTVLEYTYTRGQRYRLTFDDSFGVTFQMLSDGSDARGPLPYKCRELRPEQYLVTWHVRQFGVHVTLVVDLAARTLCVAALMPPGPWEFFDISTDLDVTRVETAAGG